jgi:hypothetical protein
MTTTMASAPRKASAASGPKEGRLGLGFPEMVRVGPSGR